MTKFEQIGANFQHESHSIAEANRNFARSCNTCCSKGIRLDCDYCAISHTHALVIAYFNDNTKGD